MVGRSTTPSFRRSSGWSFPLSFITWAVRSTTRITPVSPTNMWWASSVSMKRVGVTPAFIGGQQAVGNQKSHPPAVLSDYPDIPVGGFVFSQGDRSYLAYLL